MALNFIFTADGSRYTRGLEKMRGQTKAWAGGVTSMMSSIFAGGVLLGLKRFADGLDRIHKLSLRLGKTTESLQRIGHAAELNGTTLEVVANALTKVEQNAGQAASGLKTYSDAFDRLGINAENFINLKPEDQISQLAVSYQEAKKKGTGLADILTILGGRAKEILPLLTQTPEELKKAFDTAGVASENTIQSMVRWNDQWTTLKSSIAGFLSWFVDAFQAVGVVLGAAIGAWVGIWKGAFEAIADGAAATGNAILNGLTGNFSQAKRNIDQMKNAFTGFYDNIEKQAKAADLTITEEIGKIFRVGETTARKDKQKFEIEKDQTPLEKKVDEVKEMVTPKITAKGVGEKPVVGEDESPSRPDPAQVRILSSTLASIGGGGNSAAFTTDPQLFEAKEANKILRKIERNTTPAAGVPLTPEL
jgi:hypothetical protein